MLRRAPRVIAQKALAKGMLAATAVMGQEVLSRTPRSTQATHTDPHLADSMVVDIQIDEAAGSAHAEIGFGKQGYRALWVDHGHQHVSHGGKPGPFVPANPFMRQAAISAADATIAAFEDAFVQAVNEEFE
jgi:hypothetical protein